jgi:cation diffusion facilitator family transporter
MAVHDLSAWRHQHVFDTGNVEGERRTWIVVAITAVTMVAEIAGGWITGSMALLADGWHMGTHVAALAISAMAYHLARRWAADPRFAFGTWKIEVLGAFSSALVLGIVAIAIGVESVARLARPQPIDFLPALVVAAIGLAVNLASAWILGGGHAHAGDDHGHDHGHDHHGHDHNDLNLRSAYAHVLTDAFTSVLAIAALLAGLFGGWNWVDPAMGLVGAAVIAWWSKGLLAESGRVLLDREMDSPLVGQVRSAIESDGDAQVADLHLWRVGRDRYACIVCVVADAPLAADAYRTRLAGIAPVVHATIEVNRCPGGDCAR